MSWKLIRKESAHGEVPGQESKIGFRGTRFSLSKANRLYITDYGREICFAENPDSISFCNDLRNVLGPNWKNARIRIRANGDVYASGNNALYVGNVEMGGKEIFSGYLTLKQSYDLSSKVPQLYAGPQTHGHPGERWTIPPDNFAIDKDKLGNVGNKIKKGDWIWSKSDHKNFISKIRSILSLNSGFIRFYITCDGLIVSPIPNNHWEFYGIDFVNQIHHLMKISPAAARSIQKRLELSKDDNLNAHHLLFVLGHIDDLMGGKLPEPDEDDPRTKGVDEK